MTILNTTKYFLLAVVFSLLISVSAKVSIDYGLFVSSVVYGIFAAGTLYFNKKSVLHALLIFLTSTISLWAGIFLCSLFGPTISTGAWAISSPDTSYVPLIGGAVIWVSSLSLFRGLKWIPFLIFSLLWFAVCFFVGVAMRSYGLAVLEAMFVWQALTLFLLICFFSTLFTRNQS